MQDNWYHPKSTNLTWPLFSRIFKPLLSNPFLWKLQALASLIRYLSSGTWTSPQSKRIYPVQLEVDSNLEFDSCYLPSYLLSFSFPSFETLNLFRRQDYFTCFLDIVRKTLLCSFNLLTKCTVNSNLIVGLKWSKDYWKKKKALKYIIQRYYSICKQQLSTSFQVQSLPKEVLHKQVSLFSFYLVFTGLLTQNAVYQCFVLTHVAKASQIGILISFAILKSLSSLSVYWVGN